MNITRTVLVVAVLLGLAGMFLFTNMPRESDIPSPDSQGESTQTGVPIIGTPGHAASGMVRIETGTDGKRTLIFDNFKTTPGPDLFIYLASDTSASQFISLGRLEVTSGTLRYPIPDSVTLSDFPYALTWCKEFGVLFNSANLSSLLSDAPPDEGAVCIQVITPARNIETGEIKEFPTPCDVPSGWEIVQNQVPTLTDKYEATLEAQ